jgi:tripeptidyl-peptidase-1
LAGPYVTTVGGTTKIPEVAISFSGGGFSNYFAQPTWQTTAVKKYITSFGTTSSTLYKYAS